SKRLRPHTRYVRDQSDRRAGLRPDTAQRRRPAGPLRQFLSADAGSALLLDRARNPAPDGLLLDAPSRLAPRPRLDRDPRGRDGRGGDGDSPDAYEDMGVRDRRLLRRDRGRLRRHLQFRRFSEPVRLQHLDLPALHGHSRGHGQHLGGCPRGDDSRLAERGGAGEHRLLAELECLSLEPPDRRAEVRVRYLRDHHRADDAVPPDRPDPRAPPQARDRGGIAGTARRAPVRDARRGRARRRGTRRVREDSARMNQAAVPLLVADNVRKEFGGLLAVNDLDFTIPERSIVSLIGPNGAGKTTFFNMLTGLYRATSGTIVFDGVDITDKPPHAITKLGVGRTFQNIRLFPQMTALENVLVGMHSRLKGGILGSIFGLPRVRREEREAEEKARELLAFSGLKRVDDQLAESLAYGDQRRLEVARALATEPKLLLLDEPTAGMNPQETVAFLDFVAKLREERPIAILLIEHDMKVVMGASERVTVLDYGEKIAEGSPKEVQQDERVIEAY